MPGCHGSPRCRRVCLPALVHGDDALRLRHSASGVSVGGRGAWWLGRPGMQLATTKPGRLLHDSLHRSPAPGRWRGEFYLPRAGSIRRCGVPSVKDACCIAPGGQVDQRGWTDRLMPAGHGAYPGQRICTATGRPHPTAVHGTGGDIRLATTSRPVLRPTAFVGCMKERELGHNAAPDVDTWPHSRW
jgi:hypothetical protein